MQKALFIERKRAPSLKCTMCALLTNIESCPSHSDIYKLMFRFLAYTESFRLRNDLKYVIITYYFYFFGLTRSEV